MNTIYVIEDRLANTRKWHLCYKSLAWTIKEEAENYLESMSKTPGFQYKIVSYKRHEEVTKTKSLPRNLDAAEYDAHIY